MSQVRNNFELPDAAARERAVSTFDRNLVVTAGAGTGKTTLLVDRLVHLLLRSPDPLRITEIVALTFTNKAADEMKVRLRERLQSYLGVRLDLEPVAPAERKAKKDLESLLARYPLSKDEVDLRIQDALRNIERSDIGTIHSFAATLLRLYPLEAGVDPQFREDDGKQFDRLFDEQWSLWLDQELTANGRQTGIWRTVLGKAKLEHVKALAKSFCCETVEIRREKPASADSAEPLRVWLAELESRAAALIESHPDERMNQKLVRAALDVIRSHDRVSETTACDLAEAESLIAEKSINRTLRGWSDEEIDEARDLVRAARGLCHVDTELADLLWELLSSFAETFRNFFVRQGFVSFDGLLMRARDLVRDLPRVREELKRQYKAILIDEFQDTDPIQYEILLYLAEEQGKRSRSWRQVKLTPGKVFIVGDPKQSIYAFRRADIEAYLEVVEKIIKAQAGAEYHLTTNFRSNAAVLDVVNGVFSPLMRKVDGAQPPYIDINAAPGRPEAADPNLPPVAIRKIVAAEEIDAEKARRLEGENLASWLQNEVLGKTILLTAAGERVRAQPKDVAILFRKLTDIHDYLESFRRRGIRYVVEGERHFYAAKEIIDTVNLLRAVDNPYDRLALVGILRSPLGGLIDRQIYELHEANALDYRKAEILKELRMPPALAELYRTLAQLHEETGLLPVGEAVTRIFDALPLKLLAASYFHGEQAVANLEKLRQQAILLGAEGSTTLKETVRQLQDRVLDVKEEGESVLAEENLDAVRIMSIHKAKGLEFPIVILAGCQSGTDGRLTSDADALFDWSTGLTGLRIGPFWNLAGLFIAEKTRLRGQEEQKRVLYVAMTRAREHLVISCAPSSRRMGGSFLSLLDQSLSESIQSIDGSKTLRAGSGGIDLQVLTQDLTAPGKTTGKNRRVETPDWQPFIDAWAKRRARYHSVLQTSPFLTPTRLKLQAEENKEFTLEWGRDRFAGSLALVIGDLAHAFLRTWDFAGGTGLLRDRLRAFFDRRLSKLIDRDRAEIESDLESVLTGFLRSEAYAELAGARILGREVPLMMPWGGQVMEGVIDLIYELNGLLYLADYKTDRIDKAELHEAAARHHQQAEIYSRAVRQSLGRDPAGFKIIFLRFGEAVEIGSEKNKEPWLF